jgi:hypothetical protein
LPQSSSFTLLDNDYMQNDLKKHLEREYSTECRDRYWTILEDLMKELGYRDYLGVQRYRMEHPTDVRLLAMSSYLVDYPSPIGCIRVRSTSWTACAPGARRQFYPTET